MQRGLMRIGALPYLYHHNVGRILLILEQLASQASSGRLDNRHKRLKLNSAQ